jgi:6,7-dimethyl-8-ribityllumazine synthase
MATANLSEYDFKKVPLAKGMAFAIVVSEWNFDVTGKLLNGAMDTLLRHGAHTSDIILKSVPGSFELVSASNIIAQEYKIDAVICLGCVIRGGTPHFDYVCQGVTQGIAHLNVKYNIPFIFGLLTTDDQQQALDRAGGKHGNKGDEAAVTAIKMVDFKRGLGALSL